MIGATPEWFRLAACHGADPESWWPEVGDYATALVALRVCNGDGERPACPVRDACLDYAFETRQHDGIWGGYTARERLALRMGRTVRPRPEALPRVVDGVPRCGAADSRGVLCGRKVKALGLCPMHYERRRRAS